MVVNYGPMGELIISKSCFFSVVLMVNDGELMVRR